jgi:hypothetical protein
MRWLAALALATLVACSSAEPSTGPEPTASASPSASSEVQEFVGEGPPFEAGRVRSSAFEPPFTFAVPEGWSGGHDYADYFDVWNGEDLVVGFGTPISIPSPHGRIEVASLTPRGALRAVGALVADPSPITETKIDYRPAVEVSFPVDRRTGLLRFEGGTLHVEPPWRVRAIALEVDGTLVIVLVQARAPGADRPDTPILTSIDFEA